MSNPPFDSLVATLMASRDRNATYKKPGIGTRSAQQMRQDAGARVCENFRREEIEAAQRQTAAANKIIAEQNRALAKCRSALLQCETYFEEREDVVDGSYGEPRPNTEMQILTEVREALQRVHA